MIKKGFMFTDDNTDDGRPIVVQGDLIEEALETYIFNVYGSTTIPTINDDDDTWVCDDWSGTFIEIEILIGV